jgi:RNA polymerase sigma-70 factor (ECF subfamily)
MLPGPEISSTCRDPAAGFLRLPCMGTMVNNSGKHSAYQHSATTPGTMINKNSDIKAWFHDQIEQNTDSLFSVAMRLTRNSADAEDLVAECVAKAWTSLRSLQDHNRFRPWIFRILHNRFFSDCRKQAVRPKEQSFDESGGAEQYQEVAGLLIQQPDEFLDWWANPEHEVINNMLGTEIIRAIESLPEAFKMTVVLINLEGFSYDEAAEVLGVSPGTVRSRMNRGRTLLQKALWQHARDAGLIKDNMPMEGNT